MATPVLPLSNVIDVIVEISPQLPAVPTFNQGLFVGTSNVIPSIGANPRIRQYNSLVAMASDGFGVNAPEYIAAGIAFSQLVPPQSVFIGRQDLTAIATASVSTPTGDGGTDYVVGDIITVTQLGAQGGQLKVTTIGVNGVVTGLAIIPGSQGTLYSVATALATTTGGHGTGLFVDITAVGETPLQAVAACRAANASWWAFTVLTVVQADILALAAFAQSQIPQCCYFFGNTDITELNGGTTTTFAQLKALSYNRTIGIYSTTQGGLFPNNIYAQCAVMGVAMGLNTGLAGSYYTLKFKTLVGVGVEPLTLTQVNNIEGNNGNLYLTYTSFTWFEQGTMSNGQFFDEIINLDMLASNIKFNVADLLVSNNVIPQTNPGQTQILNVINQACATSAAIGFLAGGTWQGVTIPTLTPGGVPLLTAGTPLPNGYKAVSDTYANQSQSDKQARKSMPAYVAIIEAGAVHSVVIGVFVQR